MEHYDNENNTQEVYSQSSFSKKPVFLFGVIISVVILLALIIVFIFDISFSDNSADMFLFDDVTIQQTSDEDIEENMFSGGYDFGQSTVSSCEFPFVLFQDFEKGFLYQPGDIMEVSWDMCGIGLQTFDSFVLHFYDKESQGRLGSVDLVCVGISLDSFMDQKITWEIPPYINPGSGPQGCYQSVSLDFADDFLLSLEISFARGQYKNESPFFEIDVSNFVYIPVDFNDSNFVIEDMDISFVRASSLDSTMSQVYQERIFPQFFQAPIQFANFYRVFSLSCGVDCVSEVVLVDLRDGLLYQAPRSLILNFRTDSYLFITSDRLTEAEQLSYEREYRVRWYSFDEVSKQFSVLDTKICDIVQISNIETQYVDCIQP